MFRGRFRHSLDAKGRLSIPVKFRDHLARLEDSRLIVTNYSQCLWAYPFAEWQELERKVSALPQFKPEVIALQRAFISAAVECPLDGQGRIILPAELREYAGIARDVVVLGMTRRIELWAAERWQGVFASAQGTLELLGEKLADLGL